MAPMNLVDRIRQSLAKRPGRIVLRRDLENLGSATQLSHALRTLQDRGALQRLGEGVFAKPLEDASTPPNEAIQAVLAEVLAKLGAPVIASVIKQHEIVAYVSRRVVRSRRLTIAGRSVRIEGTSMRGRVKLPKDVDDLPTSNVARYIRRLADAHHVTYARSGIDDWAEGVTRAAGDNVRANEVESLLIRLKERHILTGAQLSRLISNYCGDQVHV
jgi:hypothetical protein